MSVVIPPPARDSGHRRNASLPSYTAAMNANKDVKVGATYPPPQVQQDVVKERPVHADRSNRAWLLSASVLILLICYVVVMITLVSPGATCVVFLGIDENGVDKWMSAIEFWSNDIPLNKGFIRSEIGPEQSVFVALGVAHIFALIAAFLLLSVRCLKHTGHAVFHPAHRRFNAAEGTTWALFWFTALVTFACAGFDWLLAKKANKASIYGMVRVLLEGGSIPYNITWACAAISLIGTLFALERRRLLRSNATHDSLRMTRREQSKLANDLEENNNNVAPSAIYTNGNVGAPVNNSLYPIKEEEDDQQQPSTSRAGDRSSTATFTTISSPRHSRHGSTAKRPLSDDATSIAAFESLPDERKNSAWK